MPSTWREDPARWFSAADREAVGLAARRAEAGHAGEIVPYVVRHCAMGAESAWMAAAAGALAGAGAAALIANWWSLDWPLAIWILAPPFLGASLGWLLSWLLPGLEARILSADAIDRRVATRARLAFLDEAVFNTRDRSGLLIFIALRERRALVLADEGISARVGSDEWQAIIDGIVAQIRVGRPAAGLVEAIEACGVLLERQGPPVREDDSDELSDALRISGD